MAHAQKRDFRLSAKRTSPFKSARWGGGVSSVDYWHPEVCAISGSNAGYTVFWGSVQDYWLPTPLACFPFTSPTMRRRVPSGFNWAVPIALSTAATVARTRLSAALYVQHIACLVECWIYRKLRRRARLKRDGTRAEIRFGLSAQRTNPFKSAEVGSVHSTTGSRGVRISSSNGSNVGYTKFWGRVQDYWLPTPLASFPFTSPTVRRRVPSGFSWASTVFEETAMLRDTRFSERRGREFSI